jgi:hypothetical protein
LVFNEYAGSGDFRFDDDSAVQFFIRAGNSPYHWTDSDWQPFVPDAPLPENFRGRYVQFAADFYPSGDGEPAPTWRKYGSPTAPVKRPRRLPW